MPVSIERWRPRTAMSPWRTLMNMDELDRPFFQNFFNRPYSSSLMRPFYASEEMGWSPAMDVLEKEDRFIVRADLPGMSEDDIDVSVVGDTLTIKGERESELTSNEESYYCNECFYGSFSRSMTLPSSINTENIHASYEDGILEINLPKAADVQSKKIQIEAKKG